MKHERVVGTYLLGVCVGEQIVVPVDLVVVLAWHSVPLGLVTWSEECVFFGCAFEVVLLHTGDEGREHTEDAADRKAGDCTDFESC